VKRIAQRLYSKVSFLLIYIAWQHIRLPVFNCPSPLPPLLLLLLIRKHFRVRERISKEGVFLELQSIRIQHVPRIFKYSPFWLYFSRSLESSSLLNLQSTSTPLSPSAIKHTESHFKQYIISPLSSRGFLFRHIPIPLHLVRRQGEVKLLVTLW